MMNKYPLLYTQSIAVYCVHMYVYIPSHWNIHHCTQSHSLYRVGMHCGSNLW